MCFSGPGGEVRMVGVGRSKVAQVVARPGVAGVAGQDAPLGLDLAQGAGRVVESHVLSNRGVEAGEVNLTEVDGVSVGRPLTASVTVAASGQVGLLIQSRLKESHQLFSHRGILDVAPDVMERSCGDWCDHGVGAVLDSPVHRAQPAAVREAGDGVCGARVRMGSAGAGRGACRWRTGHCWSRPTGART